MEIFMADMGIIYQGKYTVYKLSKLVSCPKWYTLYKKLLTFDNFSTECWIWYVKVDKLYFKKILEFAILCNSVRGVKSAFYICVKFTTNLYCLEILRILTVNFFVK